jgi:predicted O-linked N-acetylglucosamine transferase (SPINDLY family)
MNMLATAEAQRGNYQECLNIVGKSLKINKNNPNTHNLRGNAFLELNRLNEALQSYSQAVHLQHDYPVAHNNRGTALKGLGRFEEAIQCYDHAIQQKPDYPEPYYNRGIALQELKRFDEALQSYHHAISLKPDYPKAHNNYGIILQELSCINEALQSYDRAIQLKPDYFEACNNRGTALKELKRFEESLQSFDHAIQLNPDYPEAYYNRGLALQELKRIDEALQSYEHAIQLKPGYPEAYNNRGIALVALKHFKEALLSFYSAIQLKPEYPEACINRGIAFQELNRLEEALHSYEHAIQLKSDDPEAFINQGIALIKLKLFDEALLSYDHAIQLRPDDPEAHVNRGVALQELKRLDEAVQSYTRAIQLKPASGYWPGNCFYVKLGCCDWENFDEDRNELLNGIINNTKVSTPFVAIFLTDSLEIHNRAAKIYLKDKCFPNEPTLKLPKYPLHEKIRIGYFSANFHDHAVLHLIAEMFEKHDRSRYELYGFSFGPDSDDPWRIRSQKCFDHFFDVRFMSDQDVAEFARKLQIDIAVDLMGFTADLRPNIFARRAAPIQVNYLGYPGTLGADFIDYIVADKTIIPESDRHHYTEKVVYLPNSYLVNCRNRDVSQKMLTKGELYLPHDGFVYCCFNNSHKFTPEMFDVWMRILNQVDKSVLWLFENNIWAEKNLRMEAEKRGVDANRLVFAQKVPRVEDHLNRIRHADLFLDTLPYNAHTTACDSLRMGVPLVTCKGNAFAGRVAASLLKTLDLEELITHSADEYEKTAVDLAINRNRFEKIREKLNTTILTSPLFDSEMFTRHMEKAYEMMYERYQNDFAPGHFAV